MVNLIKSCDLCERQTNKQFNSDSQRLALSLRVEFSVYGALFKFSVCAAHTLIGRYKLMPPMTKADISQRQLGIGC